MNNLFAIERIKCIAAFKNPPHKVFNIAQIARICITRALSLMKKNIPFGIARSIEFRKSLNPSLQSFDNWLEANKTKIPLE